MLSYPSTPAKGQIFRSVCWRCTLSLEHKVLPRNRSYCQTSSHNRGTKDIWVRIFKHYAKVRIRKHYAVAENPKALIERTPTKKAIELPIPSPRVTYHQAPTFNHDPGGKPSPRGVPDGGSGKTRVEEQTTAHSARTSMTTELKHGKTSEKYSYGKPECTPTYPDSWCFRQTLLGLIEDDLKASNAVVQQTKVVKTLRSSNQSGLTPSSPILKRHAEELSKQRPQSDGFQRRPFSLLARYASPERVQPVGLVNNDELPAAPYPSLQNEDIRDYLASWQKRHDGEESNIRAAFGIPQPSLGAGAPHSIAINETDEGDIDLDTKNSLDDDLLDLSGAQAMMNHGDLLEIIVDNRCIVGILTQRFPHQIQLLTQFGRWVHVSAVQTSFYFNASEFCHPDDLKAVLPYMPSKEVAQEQLMQLNNPFSVVPQHASQPLLRKMNKFIREADEVYRIHAKKIDAAYESLAHERDISWLHINEITKRILGLGSSDHIPPSTTWAMHRHLILHNLGFLPEPRIHWRTGTYEIISRQDMSLVNQIRYWVREHQEYKISMMRTGSDHMHPQTPKKSVLADFADRIKPIIDKSRTFRQLSPVGSVGPSTVQLKPTDTKVTFRSIPIRAAQPSETLILRFLEFWSARKSTRIGSPLASLGPMILRSTGFYEEKRFRDMNANLGLTLLQEAGVIAPWETRIGFDSRLALPGLNLDMQTDRLLISAAESARNWELVDTMAHLRQDWGEMEVFCIDQFGTREVDDGFSLEPIPGDNSCYWIHIHIANPTAFIAPGHPIAAYAEQLTATLYFPGKVYNMLSPQITQKHFSLAPGRPVLTFSAKITLEGELLETRITPSRIHNITSMEPSTAYRYLYSHKETPSHAKYTIGHAPPLVSAEHLSKFATSLTADQFKKIQMLHRLAAARRDWCTKQSMALHGSTHSNLRTASTLWMSRMQEAQVHYSQMEFPWRRVLRRVEGDPTIEMAVSMFEPGLINKDWFEESVGSTTLVSNVMLLAGEIGASWCAARGIPIIYRGTVIQDRVIVPEHSDRLNEARLPGQKGELVFFAAWHYLRAHERGLTAAQSIRHNSLMTDAYAKVTSPLRRYGDMVAHWQIEAALRHEAKLGRPLTETDLPNMPFSKSRVQNMAERVTHRESVIKVAKVSADTAWCHQLLMRAHHFNEPTYPDTLPEFYEGFVLEETVLGFIGKLKELNRTFQVLRNDPDGHNSMVKHMALGDWWKLRMIHVSPHEKNIKMEPVELISRL